MKAQERTVRAVRLLILAASAVVLFGLMTAVWAQTTANQTPPQLVVQSAHSRLINAIAFSPDGRTLASGASDDTLRLWDVKAGIQLRTIKNDGSLESLVFSPDGTTLATGDDKGRVKLWNIRTGDDVLTLSPTYVDVFGKPSSFGPVGTVAFSPDGKKIAVGLVMTVKVWDASNGKELLSLKMEAPANAVAFSPDGKNIAAGGYKTVRIWNLGNGAELYNLDGHNAHVGSIAFSPDGHILASGSRRDAFVTLWDTSNGKPLRNLATGGVGVTSLAFTPDGKSIAGGTTYYKVAIKVWDVASAKELHAFGDRDDSYSSADGPVASIAISPDGKGLACASENRIRMWDVVTRNELSMFGGHGESVGSIVITPDGKTLVSGIESTVIGVGTVKLWDLANGKLVRSIGNGSIFAISSDGNLIANSDGREWRLNIFNVSTGTIDSYDPKLPPHLIAFSPDGNTIAVDDGLGTIKLWNVHTGRGIREMKWDPPPPKIDPVMQKYMTPEEIKSAVFVSKGITSMCFSPDGSILATGNDDRTVRLWDVRNGDLLRTLSGHRGDVRSVAFSPNGKILASGSGDKSVKLWNLTSGSELRSLNGHSDSVYSIAFSPDGKILATGSTDKTIKLWDLSTGKETRTFAAHFNVAKVVFMPNQKYIAAGGWDEATIKIWDLDSTNEIANLVSLGPDDWLVVTPDGLFDGSPAAWNKILWRFNNDTLDYAPVEAFFNDFYYPGLLADIFAGKQPKAKQDVSQKDRRQPTLKLSTNVAQPEAAITARNVNVKIDLLEAGSDKNHKSGSGAQDVRLFRNGSLVKAWRGDVLKGKSSVTLEATIPVVAGENKFTAYAFNHDNIKSSDATLIINGADSLKRQGTAYVLAVGVNHYANQNYNLKYAVADAADFAAEIKRQQESLKRYAKVEVIPLANERATKANITQKLSELSTRVQPEDAVIVFFAGHGTAQGNQFYLIPHDLGYTGAPENINETGLKTILAHSISDRELEKLFEGIDAGQLLLVIDACNSGQALEAEEKRRGPMNSKGLAQLAYEKGMYVMTASQSYQAALEAERFGHGFLTYALVEEGLKKGSADREPKNGAIDIREWLNFATDEVPKMQEQSSLDALRGRGKRIIFVGDGREVGIPTNEGGARDNIQRPRVFYRRELELNPLVVATVGALSPK